MVQPTTSLHFVVPILRFPRPKPDLAGVKLDFLEIRPAHFIRARAPHTPRVLRGGYRRWRCRCRWSGYLCLIRTIIRTLMVRVWPALFEVWISAFPAVFDAFYPALLLGTALFLKSGIANVLRFGGVGLKTSHQFSFNTLRITAEHPVFIDP